MKDLMRWITFAAALYVPCAALFYAANVATIVAIRGLEPLTWDVLWAIFLRDALMAILIAMVFSLLLMRVWPRDP
jgi:hypothetical protein